MSAFFFNEGILFDWALIIFGTETDPLKDNQNAKIPTVTTSQPDTSTKEENSDDETRYSGK